MISGNTQHFNLQRLYMVNTVCCTCSVLKYPRSRYRVVAAVSWYNRDSSNRVVIAANRGRDESAYFGSRRRIPAFLHTYVFV